MRVGIGIGLNYQRGGGSGESIVPGANLITVAAGPANNRVFQRAADTGGAFNLGTASVPFALTFSAAVSRLDYRVLNEADLAPLTGWAQVGTSYALGVNNVNVTVPARLGWVRVEFRTEFSATTVVVANRFGVGRVMFMAGQSLAVRMFGKIVDTTTLAALGLTPNANGVTYATYEDGSRSSLTPAWVVPADASNIDSAGAVAILNDQIAAFGVQCALVGHSEGATAIAAFLTGGAAYTQMTDIMTAVGGWEEFIWFQGHSDSQSGTTQLVYYDRLTTLFADVTSRNSRGASYERVLCSVPNIGNTSWGTADRIAGYRQVQKDWADINGGVVVYPIDVQMVADGVHQDQVGALRLGSHFSRAMRGLAVPTITSATRINGTDIELAVSLPSGATSLVSVGSPATRFNVFLRGRTDTPLALDGVTPITVGTNTITLKLAASQANNVHLDVWLGRGADTGNGDDSIILDNSSDGFSFGRQVYADPRPITAPAITPAATGVALANGTPAPAYAVNTGFGQMRTSGRALSAANGLPLAATYTIEARLRKSAAGATEVAIGESNTLYVGVHSSGRLLASIYPQGGGAEFSIGTTTTAAAGTNPIITDANWHHVAVVLTPGHQRLYLDGALVAASTGSTKQVPPGIIGVGYFHNFSFEWVGDIDEVAIWHTEKYRGPSFTVPTAPYVGTEPGLFQLWHLDGNGNSGL